MLLVIFCDFFDIGFASQLSYSYTYRNMPHSFGYRAHTRTLFKKPFKTNGRCPTTTYLRTFKVINNWWCAMFASHHSFKKTLKKILIRKFHGQIMQWIKYSYLLLSLFSISLRWRKSINWCRNLIEEVLNTALIVLHLFLTIMNIIYDREVIMSISKWIPPSTKVCLSSTITAEPVSYSTWPRELSE